MYTLILGSYGKNSFLDLGIFFKLYDLKILDKVNSYASTSIGTLICALFYIGMTPLEVMYHISETRLINFISEKDEENKNISFFERFKECIEDLYPSDVTLKDMYNLTKIKFTSYIYDTQRNKIIELNYLTFPDMTLLNCLKLSFSCHEIEYNSSTYLDGSIAEPLPIINEDENIKIYIFSYPENLSSYKIYLAKKNISLLSENNNIVIISKIKDEPFLKGWKKCEKIFSYV